MSLDITIHTSRTLHAKWEERYVDIKKHIEKLKIEFAESPYRNEKNAIRKEMNELYIQANLIHQFLSDVGLMVNVENKTHEGIVL